MQPRLGIDLGGTKIEIAALDVQGEIIFQQRLPTPKGDYNETLATIESLVHSAEKKIKRTGLPLGVGTPGAISPQTGLIKNSNSLCLAGKPLDKDLEKLLKRPVRLANDANCFALSEAIDGAGRDHNTVFGVILGTGCGGGVVVNKKVITGRNALAGEWGHNSMPWLSEAERSLPACYCGRKHCNELYISGTGFARTHQNKFGMSLKAEEIVAAADRGDSQARTTLDLFLDQLARAISQVINLLDPDVVVFGGGLSNVQEIYEKLPRLVKHYAFSDEFTTPLVKAKYGDSSGVRGAAWLF